jgi:hypothetical protein
LIFWRKKEEEKDIDSIASESIRLIMFMYCSNVLIRLKKQLGPREWRYYLKLLEAAKEYTLYINSKDIVGLTSYKPTVSLI